MHIISNFSKLVNETGEVCPFSPHDHFSGRKPAEFGGDIDQFGIFEIQSPVSFSVKAALQFLLIYSRFPYGIPIEETHCLQQSFERRPLHHTRREIGFAAQASSRFVV